MSRIVYLGENSPNSTSWHRAKAIERLGHEVIILNPYSSVSNVKKNRFLWPFHYRTGYRFLQQKVKRWIRKVKPEFLSPDCIWVNSGELFGPDCLRLLRECGCPVILYNNDDPTGGRDGRRFDSLLKAIRFYDCCLVLREKNIKEYEERGARKVIRVFMSYDEVFHKPFEDSSEIPPEFISEVAFIGTWMPGENRDQFLLELISAGVPVSIWGSSWKSSRYWKELQPYYRGAALGGRDYVAGIQGAKISIGMLSKGNRDLHTRRSVEVPYVGGLLCAERTSEHMQMYEEGAEAVFWDNAEECAKLCKELLADDKKRESIKVSGMQKVRQLGVGNEDIVRKGLQAVGIPG